MPHAVILSDVPSRLAVGESVSWKWSDGRFPASGGWSLVYSLVNRERQIQITATADGTAHLVEVTAATSAAYVAGTYSFQAHVAKGDERYQVASGTITIAGDLATESTGTDTRTLAQKMVSEYEAVLIARASKTQGKQMVGGVDVTHKADAEIEAEWAKGEIRRRKEAQRSRGNALTRTLRARFGA